MRLVRATLSSVEEGNSCLASHVANFSDKIDEISGSQLDRIANFLAEFQDVLVGPNGAVDYTTYVPNISS